MSDHYVEIMFIVFGKDISRVKYPYTKTIHMIFTKWSLTPLFLLYNLIDYFFKSLTKWDKKILTGVQI